MASQKVLNTSPESMRIAMRIQTFNQRLLLESSMKISDSVITRIAPGFRAFMNGLKLIQ